MCLKFCAGREAQDVCVDLGAMRIPVSHNTTAAYINARFNLTWSEFVMENDNAMVYFNNIGPVRRKTFEKAPQNFGFNLNISEMGKTATQLFNEALEPVMKELAAHGWDYLVEKYDRYNVLSYLSQVINFMKIIYVFLWSISLIILCTTYPLQTGLSKGALNLIGEMLNEESIFFTSLLEAIRDQVTRCIILTSHQSHTIFITFCIPPRLT